MPRRRFDLSPGAAQDLIDIWEYIARDKPEAASRWERKLLIEIRALSKNPNIGHTRTDIAGDVPVLFWPVGAYQIVYRKLDGRIQIVTIAQPGRDVATLLHRRLRGQ